MPAGLMCDFCSAPQVGWCYPARDFIDVGVITPTGFLISESVGGWAACEECHRLIEAGNREALLRRSMEQFAAIYGFLPPALAEDVGRIQTEFFANRRGPAIVVAPIRQAQA